MTMMIAKSWALLFNFHFFPQYLAYRSGMQCILWQLRWLLPINFYCYLYWYLYWVESLFEPKQNITFCWQLSAMLELYLNIYVPKKIKISKTKTAIYYSVLNLILEKWTINSWSRLISDNVLYHIHSLRLLYF